MLLWLDEEPEKIVEVKCSVIPGYSFKYYNELAADMVDVFASTFLKVANHATAAVSPVLQRFEILLV